MKRDLFFPRRENGIFTQIGFTLISTDIAGLLLTYLIVTSQLMNLQLKINEIILILNNNFTYNFE